jgi:hypothetical protein
MERKRVVSWKDWRVSAVGGAFAGFVVALLIFRWPGHLPPAWGDIPGWITAVATVGLLLGAIITAGYAIKAFGEQAREVAILVEENKRQGYDRHRAQASQVFVLANPHIREGEPISSIEVTVKNTSQQPIYDLNLLWRDESGKWTELDDPVDLRVLLPGDEHKWSTSIEPSIPIGAS